MAEAEHRASAVKVDVPVEAIQIIDPQVVSKLAPGTVIASITPHGVSAWTRTAMLNGTYEDEPARFFLKVSAYARGRAMMEGEYTSMSCIHAIVPDLCPRPIAWGTYQTLPDTHFFLCEFRDMTGQPPDAVPFAKKMAELHSKAVSPNGKFGFPVRTHHGHIPIDHDWADTWEEYFSTRKRPLIELEEASQGPSADLRQLSEPFFDVVVPRLLRPLETEGRKILPRLVHGDCWDGNASMDERSGLPIIFDAASFYAHNEYELAVWRAAWNRIDKSSVRQYIEHMGKSLPEEDFDDRVTLYATRVDILDSILYTGVPEYRADAINKMQYLVKKCASHDSVVVGGVEMVSPTGESEQRIQESSAQQELSH